MTEDEIKIGRTYRMKAGTCDRHVIDILWHPSDYREVVCQFRSGKQVGRIENVPLKWFAWSARHEIP